MVGDAFRVNEKIHEIRLAKKLPILKVSVESGISRSHLYYIETKKVSPTVETLYRLADVLDVDVTEFFSAEKTV